MLPCTSGSPCRAGPATVALTSPDSVFFGCGRQNVARTGRVDSLARCSMRLMMMITGEETPMRNQTNRWSIGAVLGRVARRLDNALLHIELPEDVEPAFSP